MAQRAQVEAQATRTLVAEVADVAGDDVPAAVDRQRVAVAGLHELAEALDARRQPHTGHLERGTGAAVAAGLELRAQRRRNHLQDTEGVTRTDVVDQGTPVRRQADGADAPLAHLELTNTDHLATLDLEGVGARRLRIHRAGHQRDRPIGQLDLGSGEAGEPALRAVLGELGTDTVVRRGVDHDGTVALLPLLVAETEVGVRGQLDLALTQLDLGGERVAVTHDLVVDGRNVHAQILQLLHSLQTLHDPEGAVHAGQTADAAGRDDASRGTDVLLDDGRVKNTHDDEPHSPTPSFQRGSVEKTVRQNCQNWQNDTIITPNCQSQINTIDSLPHSCYPNPANGTVAKW